MATKLWRGNTGSSVRELQQKLNQNGYKLDEDGVFGSNTYNAVLDYQRKNNLAVDGVVGDETWGSLGKVQSAPAQQSAQKSTYTPYDPGSDKAYQEALKKQQETENSKPGEYQGAYDQQLKDIYDKIMNREKFSYDLAGDPLWQQYKDQYTQQGRMAMMDTMGQAANLTGGYGNSYSQAVGQQQYNAYMQQLAAVMPELYDRARDAYDAEGNRMLQKYQLTGDLAADDYSKYQDAYNRWLTERSYAQDNANTAYDRGYNQWLQELTQRNKDREFEESVRQYNESLAEQKRQYDASLARRYSSGGGSGGSGNSGSSKQYDTHGYTEGQIKALQRNAGLTPDGVWGSQTEKAYQNGYRWNSYRGATDKNGAMNQSYFDAYMSGIASNLRNGNTDSAKASAQQIVNSLSDEQYAKMKSVFAAHGISIG